MLLSLDFVEYFFFFIPQDFGGQCFYYLTVWYEESRLKLQDIDGIGL